VLKKKISFLKKRRELEARGLPQKKKRIHFDHSAAGNSHRKRGDATKEIGRFLF